MSDQRLKMIFGFCLLLELGILATIVGLGTVRMETSYGLNIILGSLATLSGMFAQWAFARHGSAELEQQIKAMQEEFAKVQAKLNGMKPEQKAA